MVVLRLEVVLDDLALDTDDDLLKEVETVLAGAQAPVIEGTASTPDPIGTMFVPQFT